MDKQKEKEILLMIFSPDLYSVSETEEPDFILEDRITRRIFGVEITAVFYSESDARLINIPGYSSKIIDKEQYLHKNDVTKFPVEKVKIYLSGLNESSKDTKLIISDIPSRDEIGNIVGNTIIKKNEKLSNYKKKAENNYLIIFDNENFIKSKSGLFQGIFNLNLFKTIIDSDFEEIYLLTRIKTEMIYYELKSACFIFLALLTLSFTKCYNIENSDKYNIMLDVLNQLGFKLKIKYFNEEDCIKVKNGNSVIYLYELNNQLIINRVNTKEYLTDNYFDDYIENNSIFSDIKEQLYKYISSKNVLIDLSHKVI